jgi:hypothetical protein
LVKNLSTSSTSAPAEEKITRLVKKRNNFVIPKNAIMATILEQEWLSYFTRLNEPERKSVLQLLKTFLQRKQQSQERIDLAQYNTEMDEALADIAAGNFITQEEMEKQASEW